MSILSSAGFAYTIKDNDTGLPWKRIFQLTFFVGMLSSPHCFSCPVRLEGFDADQPWLGMFGGYILYVVICYIFPIKDARVRQDYDWSVETAVALEGKEVTADEELGRGGSGSAPEAFSEKSMQEDIVTRL
jgi:hypothetical protein